MGGKITDIEHNYIVDVLRAAEKGHGAFSFSSLCGIAKVNRKTFYNIRKRCPDHPLLKKLIVLVGQAKERKQNNRKMVWKRKLEDMLSDVSNDTSVVSFKIMIERYGINGSALSSACRTYPSLLELKNKINKRIGLNGTIPLQVRLVFLRLSEETSVTSIPDLIIKAQGQVSQSYLEKARYMGSYRFFGSFAQQVKKNLYKNRVARLGAKAVNITVLRSILSDVEKNNGFTTMKAVLAERGMNRNGFDEACKLSSEFKEMKIKIKERVSMNMGKAKGGVILEMTNLAISSPSITCFDALCKKMEKDKQDFLRKDGHIKAGFKGVIDILERNKTPAGVGENKGQGTSGKGKKIEMHMKYKHLSQIGAGNFPKTFVRNGIEYFGEDNFLKKT